MKEIMPLNDPAAAVEENNLAIEVGATWDEAPHLKDAPLALAFLLDDALTCSNKATKSLKTLRTHASTTKGVASSPSY